MHKVYILQCSDGTYYTGYAKCFSKRFVEHLTKVKGAKYTSRGIEKLVYISFFASQGDALREERRIKELSRAKKIELINNQLEV
ncbi:MAG: GIY-YIG nuclease family protein [Bacillota bacterium]|nr:GIY-YIG nuclease family protein [Bacillota bacterium]